MYRYFDMEIIFNRLLALDEELQDLEGFFGGNGASTNMSFKSDLLGDDASPAFLVRWHHHGVLGELLEQAKAQSQDKLRCRMSAVKSSAISKHYSNVGVPSYPLAVSFDYLTIM